MSSSCEPATNIVYEQPTSTLLLKALQLSNQRIRVPTDLRRCGPSHARRRKSVSRDNRRRICRNRNHNDVSPSTAKDRIQYRPVRKVRNASRTCQFRAYHRRKVRPHRLPQVRRTRRSKVHRRHHPGRRRTSLGYLNILSRYRKRRTTRRVRRRNQNSRLSCRRSTELSTRPTSVSSFTDEPLGDSNESAPILSFEPSTA